MQIRSVAGIVPGIRTLEGEGFLVRRPFPTQGLDHFDPFLLLDEMGPMDLAPGQAKGAPDHPHRGFETVTYLVAGEFEHGDSAGNHGRLNAGDVQWMTAGAGVVHSEMPSQRIQREGGRVHGFQLWVNLPRKEKMIPPRYQDTAGERIPVVEADAGRVRVKVVAGEAFGVGAVIDTRTPILYFHVTVQPGGRFEAPVPPDFNVFAYVFGGAASFAGETLASEGDMVAFARDGAAVAAANTGTLPLDFLLVGGRPLGEPVARYGPFVMNEPAEIHQAIRDYQAGRMGRIITKESL